MATVDGNPILYFRAGLAGDGTNNRRFEPVRETTQVDRQVQFGTTAATVGYKQVMSHSTPNNETALAAPPAAARGTGGWNILEADMDPPPPSGGRFAPPVKRVLPAGTHPVTFWVSWGGIDTGTGIYRYQVRWYKRKSDGTYSALIATGELADNSIPAIFSQRIVNVVTTDPIVFENDETLHMELWVRGRGVAVTGQTLSYAMGTSAAPSNNYFQFASPGLLYLYPRSGSATMIGLGSRQPNFARLTRTATALGLASAVRVYTGFRKPSATMIGVSTRSRSFIAVRALSAVMLGLAARQGNWVRKAPFLATGLGTSTVSRRLWKTATATMIGLSAMGRASIATRSFQATMIGQASMIRAVIVVRMLQAAMIGRASGRIEMPMTALNRIEGGGGGTPVIIKKPIFIFD